jgi:hypothetical protein
VHLHVLSALLSTTSFFALKKNSLTALSMQVAKHSHVLRDKYFDGAQILWEQEKEELPFT